MNPRLRTAALLVASLWWINDRPLQAQETPADEPSAVSPTAPAQAQPDAQPKTAAPVERRAVRPTAGAPQPVAGPLTKGASGQATEAQPAGTDRNAGTIRVETRLVNVATECCR